MFSASRTAYAGDEHPMGNPCNWQIPYVLVSGCIYLRKRKGGITLLVVPAIGVDAYGREWTTFGRPGRIGRFYAPVPRRSPRDTISAGLGNVARASSSAWSAMYLE